MRTLAGLYADKDESGDWHIRRECDRASVLGFVRTKKAAEYLIRRMASMDIDWSGDVQASFDSVREFRNAMFDLKMIAVSGDIPTEQSS